MNNKKELRDHLQKNLELLTEVVYYETAERQAVKENLAEFHEALREHRKIQDAALAEKHREDLAELDEQIERLKKCLSQHTSE